MASKKKGRREVGFDTPQLVVRNEHQKEYYCNILSHDVTFGIGPAGTGKTFLAVATAIDAFEKGIVKRLVFTRPAVEAGEKLGFLPGDISEKVNPYLRPLYDSLYELIGEKTLLKMLEAKTVEIAPLAFMRGRTFKDTFVIADEAQNTSITQMKMLLTRLGDGSKMVITGDITQIDIDQRIKSGLLDAIQRFVGIPEISIVQFDAQDIVRHPLIHKILSAYGE